MRVAAALAAVTLTFAPAAAAELRAVAPPLAVKVARGARRLRYAEAEPAPRYRRSRNPRHRRPLRANRLHISRRTRRRHRRGR